jgi:hypothetical protein
VAIGRGQTAAGGAEGFRKGSGGVLGDGVSVSDGDCGRRDATQGALRRERPDERVDTQRFVVPREEVAGGAEHIRGDEKAAIGHPQRDLMPAREADDAAALDPFRERAADLDTVARGDRVGVAPVAGHEESDSGHGRGLQRRIQLGCVDGIDEEPAVVEADGGRRAPQELVRMGEPREAPALVEGVRLQGARW